MAYSDLKFDDLKIITVPGPRYVLRVVIGGDIRDPTRDELAEIIDCLKNHDQEMASELKGLREENERLEKQIKSLETKIKKMGERKLSRKGANNVAAGQALRRISTIVERSRKPNYAPELMIHDLDSIWRRIELYRERKKDKHASNAND